MEYARSERHYQPAAQATTGLRGLYPAYCKTLRGILGKGDGGGDWRPSGHAAMDTRRDVCKACHRGRGAALRGGQRAAAGADQAVERASPHAAGPDIRHPHPRRRTCFIVLQPRSLNSVMFS